MMSIYRHVMYAQQNIPLVKTADFDVLWRPKMAGNETDTSRF